MKKFLLTSILALGLLASCGAPAEAESKPAADSKPTTSKPTSSRSTHSHTFDETKWEADDNQHWHPATCEHTTQKGSAAAHTLVVDATKTTPATCDTDGTEVSKCSTCGKEVTKTVKATGHVWTGTKAGNMTPETCANGHHAYRFDVADATGWNNATTKMNGRPTAEGPTTSSESKWTIDATALPAGTYDIYIVGHMSYDSHSNRTWANQWETDTAETPDKQSESPFRYWLEVGATKYNPNVTETWGELGYTAGEDQPGLNARGVTIEAGATEVKLEHGNIGYSMIISAVRFVKK